MVAGRVSIVLQVWKQSLALQRHSGNSTLQTHLEELIPCPLTLLLQAVHIIWQEPFQRKDLSLFPVETCTLVQTRIVEQSGTCLRISPVHICRKPAAFTQQDAALPLLVH